MSEPNPAPQVRLGPIERVIAGMITTAAFSMLGWLVYTTNQSTTAIALMQKDISYIQTDLKTLKQSQADQYTRASAIELERRVEKVEKKLGM